MITVSFRLPRRLDLPDGQYGDLWLAAASPDEATMVSVRFAVADGLPADRQGAEQARLAQAALAATNRLLRWCRFVTDDAAVTELTLAQASPFAFVDGLQPWGPNHGRYEQVTAGPAAFSARRPSDVADHIRSALRGAGDPPVPALLVLDARVATAEGRYREAVLLCWSAVEAAFSATYQGLLQAGLADLSGQDHERLFDTLTGRDVSLKGKMTAGLHLATGRSLHRELGDMWPPLNDSYRHRNAVIHEGSDATGEQAGLALQVARAVLDTMSRLADTQ